jgi:tellurite resistance protein
MSLWNKLTHRLRHARIARFAPAEKRALVKLAHAIAVVDNELSGAELAAAADLARALGVTFEEARDLDLADAVELLEAKPAHLELACLVVADVVFADGDYDAGEQAFVRDFAAKHHLRENVLAEAVQRLRQQKLDDALERWHDEIVGGTPPAAKDGAAADEPHREQ